MDTDEHRSTHEESLNRVTETIIGCAYRVHNALGHGFLEKVYENALVHEVRKAGLGCVQQRRFVVLYDGIAVGEYIADLIVADRVILEIKAVKNVDDSHIAQCLNYLAVTKLPICLLLNFHQRVQIKRLRGQEDA